MSSFTEPLILEVTQKDKRPFRLVKPFSFYLDDGSTIEVPKGFETDGATVPILLRAFIRPWGRHGKAAVLHDWLYRSGVPRDFADKVLLEAMNVLDVPEHRKWAIYWAVRMFGWIPYRRINRKDREDEVE